MSAHETLRKTFEAFNQHDANAFAELHAADVVIYDPQYSEPLRGRDAVRNDIEDFCRTFPDVQATLSSILADGDTVASEWEVSGTNTGPLLTPTGSLAPTDRRISMRVGMFARINESGLITESRRYYDMAGLVQQLGLQ